MGLLNLQLPNSVKCRLIVLPSKKFKAISNLTISAYLHRLQAPEESRNWKKPVPMFVKTFSLDITRLLDLLLSDNILKVHKLKAKTTCITQQLTILNTEGNIFLSLLTY